MKSMPVIIGLFLGMIGQCNKGAIEPDTLTPGRFVVDTLKVNAQVDNLAGLIVSAQATYHFEIVPGSPGTLRLSALNGSVVATPDFASPIPTDTYVQWRPKLTFNDPGTDSITAYVAIAGHYWNIQGSKPIEYGDFYWADSQRVAIIR